MKTQALTQIYALAMSAVFATIATVGVAVVMTSSGEHSRTAFIDSAAAQRDSQPSTVELSQLHGQVIGAPRML